MSTLDVLWLVPTAIAASLDTLSDIISDEVIAEAEDNGGGGDGGDDKKKCDQEAEERSEFCCAPIDPKRKLTGEQDFMVSMVPMTISSLVIMYHESHNDGTIFEHPAFVAQVSSAQGHAVIFAGLCYAVMYLMILKAWEQAPSTVIVPCLQLSSPMVELLEAALSPFHSYHPVLLPLKGAGLSPQSWVAFTIVIIGGLLPSAGDGLSELASLQLWTQPAMLWMMGANVTIAVYYVLMGLLTSEDAAAEVRLTNGEFVALTNLVAVAAYSTYVAASRPLRRQFASAYGFRVAKGVRGGDVHWAAAALSMLAEVCNYGSMYVPLPPGYTPPLWLAPPSLLPL